MARGGRSNWRLCLVALALLGFTAAFEADPSAPAMAGAVTAFAAPAPNNPAKESNLVHLVDAKTYEWWTSRDEKLIKIRGLVPSDEDRKTIHGMIKANMPDLEIDDRMEIAEGAPPKQIWLGAVSFALLQMSQLITGNARLIGTDFYIEGEARTSVTYAAYQAAAESKLPQGVTLKEASVIPPLAKPFVWTAHHEGGALTLTGHVPDETSRTKIVQHASELFGDKQIVDRMELASGSPDDWHRAAVASLRQLARLESGKVNLTDTALAIEGVAETRDIAVDVAATIRQGLPKSYDTRDSIRYRLS